MTKKYKIILKALKILLAILAIFYIGTYIFSSRTGMYDNTLGSEGKTVWAFGPLRQRMEVYFDKTSDDYKIELSVRNFYWPLIKLDKYILGNYHILEKDLPNMGG